MPVRIGPLWALLIGFIVLMASNSWFKGIFGVGEIATNVPFLLTGLVLFGIGKFNCRSGSRNTLIESARFGDLAKLEGWGELVIGRSGRNNKFLLDPSVICINPKGKNVHVTVRTRSRKSDV